MKDSILRDLRNKKGVSMAEVAKAIDYDQGNLSRIETGQRLPTIQVAESLADYYGVSLDDVLGREPKGWHE